MHEREPTSMKRLLDRLLSVRARRDRERRFSDAWLAADAELHAIERAIFRVPIEVEGHAPTKNQTSQNGHRPPGDPASLAHHREARDSARAAGAAELADRVSRTDRHDRGSHDSYEGERAG